MGLGLGAEPAEHLQVSRAPPLDLGAFRSYADIMDRDFLIDVSGNTQQCLRVRPGGSGRTAMPLVAGRNGGRNSGTNVAEREKKAPTSPDNFTSTDMNHFDKPRVCKCDAA